MFFLEILIDLTNVLASKIERMLNLTMIQSEIHCKNID